MALFKIFKGNDTAKLTDSTVTGYKTPTDGYAYYDTSTKLFYIDAEYPGVSGVSRQPINASHAAVAGNALNGAFYGTCGTAQSTKAKVAQLVDATGFTLATGIIVVIKFSNASAASTMTLTIQDSAGNTVGAAKNLELYGTTAMSSGTTTNGWRAGAVVPFVYDGANWIRFFWENSTYYYTSAYCTTGAATAAKVGAYSGVQTLTGSRYFQIWIQNTNTAASALTLNMNSLGAKKIYINGEPSSASNYNLLRGCYLVYYDADGDNGNGCYHFRTDNKIPGNITGDAGTVNGHTVASDVPANAVFTDTNKYHKTGSWSGLTYTALAVNSADELKFTIPTATTGALGAVKIGSGISVNSGTISHATPSGASSGTKGNTTIGALEFIKTITTDSYGHITAYTTGEIAVYDGTIS